MKRFLFPVLIALLVGATYAASPPADDAPAPEPRDVDIDLSTPDLAPDPELGGALVGQSFADPMFCDLGFCNQWGVGFCAANGSSGGGHVHSLQDDGNMVTHQLCHARCANRMSSIVVCRPTRFPRT